jgi:pimeloyl-ACP methyl ester carboxylesterase
MKMTVVVAPKIGLLRAWGELEWARDWQDARAVATSGSRRLARIVFIRVLVDVDVSGRMRPQILEDTAPSHVLGHEDDPHSGQIELLQDLARPVGGAIVSDEHLHVEPGVHGNHVRQQPLYRAALVEDWDKDAEGSGHSEGAV